MNLDKLFENRLLVACAIPGIVAGAIACIAGGFVTIYQLVTWASNR